MFKQKVYLVTSILILATQFVFAIPVGLPPSYYIVDSQAPTGRYHALNYAPTIQATAVVARTASALEPYKTLELVLRDPDNNEFVIDSKVVEVPIAPATAIYSLSGTMPGQFTSGFFTCIIRIVDASGSFVWDSRTITKAFIGLHHLQHFSSSSYTGDFDKLEYGNSRCTQNEMVYGKLQSALGLSSSNLTISVPSQQIDKYGTLHSDWVRGGGIRSVGQNPTFGTGFYVIRMKADLSPSLYSAANFWLYNENNNWQEGITIELRRHVNGSIIAHCVIWSDDEPQPGFEHTVSSLATSYHEFIIEWRSDRITWYDNGVQIAESRSPDIFPSSLMKICADYVIEPFGWWIDGGMHCDVDSVRGGPFMSADLIGY